MLILTRKIGESIIVGDNIRVVVLEVRGRQIRLGIDAPPDIVVLREEIAQRLVNENLQAASFNYQDVQQVVMPVEPEPGHRLDLGSSGPESPGMTIESKAWGRLTVPANQIITFPSGLPGFLDASRYALLNSHLQAPFYCLQSVDNPEVAFVVAESVHLRSDYHPKKGAADLRELQAQSPEDLRTLVILTIPPGRPREMTANLMSPLLINLKAGLGKQVIIDKPHYSHQYPVFSPPSDAE